MVNEGLRKSKARFLIFFLVARFRLQSAPGRRSVGEDYNRAGGSGIY